MYTYVCVFCVCTCVGMDMMTGRFRNPPWHVTGARFPIGAWFCVCMLVCFFCFQWCMWECLSSWPLLLIWFSQSSGCFGLIYLTSDHAFVSRSSQPRCPHTCSVVAARKVGVWAAESRIFREATGWEREGTQEARRKHKNKVQKEKKKEDKKKNYRTNLETEKLMKDWWTKRLTGCGSVMGYALFYRVSETVLPFGTGLIFTKCSLCVVNLWSTGNPRSGCSPGTTKESCKVLPFFCLFFAASCAGFWCQILSWKGRSLADAVWSPFDKSLPVQVPLLQGLSSRELDCVADMWGPWHISIWTCNMLEGPAAWPCVMRCSVKSYATGEMPSHASTEPCSYLEPSSPVTADWVACDGGHSNSKLLLTSLTPQVDQCLFRQSWTAEKARISWSWGLFQRSRFIWLQYHTSRIARFGVTWQYCAGEVAECWRLCWYAAILWQMFFWSCVAYVATSQDTTA